jgi:PAS domain S-box-containing protein
MIAAGAYALIAGALVLIGWAAGIQRLTDWAGTGISQKPNAALAALLLGPALLCLARGGSSNLCARIFAAGSALLGGLTLFQHLTGINLGIDTLLFSEPPGAKGTVAPGRMGPIASTSYLLLGAGLLFRTARRPLMRRIAHNLGLLTSLLVGIPLLGYVYGADFLYTIPRFTGIAFQTTTAILAISIGLMASVPTYGVIALLRRDDPGGQLLRRLLIPLIALPLLLGWLALRGQQLGLYDAPFGTAALTFILIVLLGGLATGNARRLGLAAARQSAERKQAEDELRRREERLQMALHVGEAGTWDMDLRSGRNIWSESHFHLLGLAPTPSGEATPEMWQSAIPAEDMDAVRAEWERAEAARDLFRSQHRMRRHDNGEVLWVRAVGRFHYDDAGKAVRFFGAVQNITDFKNVEAELRQSISARKRAEDDLREAGRRKDEFLATLAHELRNPLAPVMNSIELLDRIGEQEPLAIKARAMMRRQVRHLTRLVDDLLDISRIARDKLELRRERIELSSVLRGTVEDLRAACAARRQVLSVALPDEPVWLDADPARLAQVVGNLLHNASKYTPEGGQIALSALREGGAVRITVTDNGIGLTPEELSRVFGLFEQVHTAGKMAQGGLGIGLSLVKRLVEMHGGTVEGQSAGRGQGSTFTVRLPLPGDVPAAGEAAPQGAAPDGPAAQLRVLVVDDNMDAAESLEEILKILGHRTHTVHDGPEAIEAARRFDPHVVLLDIGLPSMSGYDVCREIRRQRAGQQPLMVALTGWGQDQDRRASAEAGFDHHLIKPVPVDKLGALLEKLSSPHR